jgi:hypothetical protein
MLLDEKQAAKHLGWSPKTLQARRFYRKPPKYLKVGRSVRYSLEDLNEFLAGCQVDPKAREG